MYRHKAYLIVICNKETNAVESAAVWSSPEWEQSRCLPQPTFVAYEVSGDSFAEAETNLLRAISVPKQRYGWLIKYLPKALQEQCIDPTKPTTPVALEQ